MVEWPFIRGPQIGDIDRASCDSFSCYRVMGALVAGPHYRIGHVARGALLEQRL